jgi:UDP-GlcNAc3NAcA epimerase
VKVVSVVGARPQFIKAAPVSRAFAAAGIDEVLVHTGQHYDRQMSAVFFEELELCPPAVNLGVGSGPHGRQTAEMLARLEPVLVQQAPKWVLVYGDTNSTLAGALAACKLQVPLAHIEAGLRSFNRAMPEEHNRVLTDHCADLLFCPTETAVTNLAREGLTDGVHLVGDTMYDALQAFRTRARDRSAVLQRLDLSPGGYLLATVHRPANTDDLVVLRRIMQALDATGEPVVFPVHPRTRRQLAGLTPPVSPRNGLRFIDPVGYLDMLTLEENARLVLTDSGGVQKEAYFLGVPCLTLRAETEWVETVQSGWNRVIGTDPTTIVAQVRSMAPPGAPGRTFGDGESGRRIVSTLLAR